MIKKLILLSLAMLMFAIVVEGQSAYASTDSFAVTTVAFDSTFTQRYETATIWFTGCDAWVKYALSSRDGAFVNDSWVKLEEGARLVIQKNYALNIPGLYRLTGKAVTGSGVCHIAGTKSANK